MVSGQRSKSSSQPSNQLWRSWTDALSGERLGGAIEGGQTSYGDVNPFETAALNLGKVAGQGTDFYGSDVGRAYENQLLNPTYGSDSPYEQAFLGSVKDQTNLGSTLKGRGQSSELELQQALAPVMMQLAQGRTQELGQATGAEGGFDIGQRGISTQGMSSLAALLAEQMQGGTTSTDRSARYGLCAFIFTQVYGEHYPILRRYRDEQCSTQMRRGYYKMADVVVPFMKKYKAIHWLFRGIMTGPCLSYVKWFYGESKIGWVFTPVAYFWDNVCTTLGGHELYVRTGGEVV